MATASYDDVEASGRDVPAKPLPLSDKASMEILRTIQVTVAKQAQVTETVKISGVAKSTHHDMLCYVNPSSFDTVIHRSKTSTGGHAEQSSDCLVSLSAMPKKSNESGKGRWTDDEERLFAEGFSRCGGWGEWKAVAKMIPTRTNIQVKTHAQKVPRKQNKDIDLHLMSGVVLAKENLDASDDIGNVIHIEQASLCAPSSDIDGVSTRCTPDKQPKTSSNASCDTRGEDHIPKSRGTSHCTLLAPDTSFHVQNGGVNAAKNPRKRDNIIEPEEFNFDNRRSGRTRSAPELFVARPSKSGVGVKEGDEEFLVKRTGGVPLSTSRNEEEHPKKIGKARLNQDSLKNRRASGRVRATPELFVARPSKQGVGVKEGDDEFTGITRVGSFSALAKAADKDPTISFSYDNGKSNTDQAGASVVSVCSSVESAAIEDSARKDRIKSAPTSQFLNDSSGISTLLQAAKHVALGFAPIESIEIRECGKSMMNDKTESLAAAAAAAAAASATAQAVAAATANNIVTSKPPRPYTEYTMFYQLEREFILHRVLTTDEERGSSLANSNNPNPNRLVATTTNNNGSSTTAAALFQNDPLMPARYRTLPLRADWYISGKSKKPTKRKHRKSHGKIGFLELTRLIASRWAQVDIETRKYCKMMAAMELVKYKEDMESYNLYKERLSVIGEPASASTYHFANCGIESLTHSAKHCVVPLKENPKIAGDASGRNRIGAILPAIERSVRYNASTMSLPENATVVVKGSSKSVNGRYAQTKQVRGGAAVYLKISTPNVWRGTRAKFVISRTNCGFWWICVSPSSTSSTHVLYRTQNVWNDKMPLNESWIAVRDGIEPAPVIRPACSIDGCTNSAAGGRICTKHGGKQIRNRCSVEGCGNQGTRRGGVCWRHSKSTIQQRKRTTTSANSSVIGTKKQKLMTKNDEATERKTQPASFVVLVAGTHEANGLYNRANRTCEGGPFFKKHGYWQGRRVQFVLFRTKLQGGTFWSLACRGAGVPFVSLYWNEDACDLPPRFGWKVNDGIYPAPYLTFKC